MKKLSLLLYIVVAFCKTTLAQDKLLYDPGYRPAVFADPDRLNKIKNSFGAIDSIFKSHAIRNHIPGLAYGIVADGNLIYSGNYGYTDIEKKIPVSSSSLFRIASMSKSFAAMAILKLRDEGKLNLDDPAHKFIPQLKQLKYLTADSPPITVRHLLTHGAGFPEDNPWGDRQLADTDKELMELLKKQVSFSNPPGVEHEYSNLGFALLGKIITVVSGMRYQDYIKKNILEPLGMKSTTYEYGDIASAKLAHGYRWQNDQWNEEELLHDPKDGSWGAMGAMISSIDEFANYVAFHLSAWPPKNATQRGPVKASSVREMHHPWWFSGFNPRPRYKNGKDCGIAYAYCFGLGWSKDCDNRIVVGHSGGLPGFGSEWRILPDFGIGIVSFANRTYAGTGSVNQKVLDTIIRIAGLEPRRLPVSAILEQRKNELVKILPEWKDAEQSGVFAENFFPDYPVDSLKKESKELFAKAGKIMGVREMKPENQLRGSFIIEGELANIEVYFTLSPENPPLIQEYHARQLAREKTR